MSTEAEMTFGERVLKAVEYRVVHPLRRHRTEVIDERSPAMAARLYRIADRIAGLPFRDERAARPKPRRIGELTIDTMEDLAAYTRLPQATLTKLVERREPISFRSEWHSTPPEMRSGHWFHLASSAYLFGNASHFSDARFVERRILPHVEDGGQVLDFGSGTGELALQLAARGVPVWAVELNALQRDFLRFRVERHGLSDVITVADWWRPLPLAAFDVAVAMDVLEHLDDCRAVLEETILPALKPSGTLVEDSPFLINASNPMHHEDFGLADYLNAHGFREALPADDNTRTWHRAGAGASAG